MKTSTAVAGSLLTATLIASLVRGAETAVLPPSSSPFLTPDSGLAKSSGRIFNVRDYGAKGDRTTKDTAAFQKALDACSTAGGGEVLVPAGNYLLGSVQLGSNTTLRLAKDAYLTESPDPADYPMVRVRFEGEDVNAHRSLIWAEKASHIAIVGEGGFYATTSLCTSRTPRPPSVIEPVDCTDVRLEDFTLQYDTPTSGQRQQTWCIHPLYCTNVTVHNLYIRSTLPYGDGLDIDSCKDVVVSNCDIQTTEDCLGIKSGRGLAAAKLAKPADNVTIRDCKLVNLGNSSNSCIAMGSELSGGLRNITITHCSMTAKALAINIKSRDGRGGVVENVTFSNLTVSDTPTFLTLNMLGTSAQASDPITTAPDRWTALRNLTIQNITLSKVHTLVIGTNIPPEQPAKGLTFANITGDCQQGLSLHNVQDANFSNITLTGMTGPLAQFEDVTGKGIDTLGLPPLK